MEQTIFIRSTGVTVVDILKALSRGSSHAQLLEQFKQITLTDILAAIQIASNLIEQHVTTDGNLKIEGTIKLVAKNSRLVNISKMRETYPRAYEPWETSEINVLIALFKKGESIPDIAKHLERGQGAIRSRLDKLELLKPRLAKQPDPRSE